MFLYIYVMNIFSSSLFFSLKNNKIKKGGWFHNKSVRMVNMLMKGRKKMIRLSLYD